MKNGETLVSAFRIEKDDLEAMNLDPDDPTCPIKEGQAINWHKFVEKARVLGMGDDKQKLVDHIQNTLAIANAVIRKRIADAEAAVGVAAAADDVARFQRYQANLIKVFKEGYANCPEVVTKLVTKAFTEAPATVISRRILSGQAEDNVQNSTINEQSKLIVEDARTDAEPGFKEIKDASGTAIANTALVTTAAENANQVSIGKYDSTSKSITFSGDNSIVISSKADSTKFTYTQVSKKYSDLVKDLAVAFRQNFGTKFFGAGFTTTDPTNIKKLTDDNKTEIRKITEEKRKGNYSTDTAALDATRDMLAERLLARVKLDGVKADLDNAKLEQITDDLIFALAKSAITSGKNLEKKEKDALKSALRSEIAALKVSINAQDLAAVPGANDSEKEKAVKESVTKLIDKIRSLEFKSNKGTFTAVTSSLDTNTVLIRDKALFEELIRNGRAQSFLAAITADANRQDDFSKIKFDAIDGLIEDIDAIKSHLLDHAPDGVKTLKDLKDRRREASPLVSALYASKTDISSESARNSAKLAAFLQLVQEAKLSDKERELVIAKLFSTRIAAVEEGSKAAEKTALMASLDRVLDSNHADHKEIFQVKIDKSDCRLVDVQGASLLRALATRDIGALVTQRASAKAVDRTTALAAAYVSESVVKDMADKSEAIHGHLTDIIEKGFDNIDDLNTALGKMPAEGLRAYNRYMRQGSQDGLTRDLTGGLEPHNASSILSDVAAFFKGLMQKFKVLTQMGSEDSSTTSKENKAPVETPKPSSEPMAEAKES